MPSPIAINAFARPASRITIVGALDGGGCGGEPLLANSHGLEVSLELDGLRAFVEEAHASGSFGHHEVLESEDGTIWLRTFERGITPVPVEALEREARTEVVEMGFVDVPSGTLTIALAYPPLNTTSTGDHAGVVHDAGERVDVKTRSKLFAIAREFTESGQVVALRPR